MKIIKPSPKEVEKYLRKWESLENYVLQESSLSKLFTQVYVTNNDLDDVLIKVCSLNDFYSTNILSPFAVAKHIVRLGIDEKLKNGNLELVNQIAKIKIKKRTINFYSFASKYCSHHKSEVYPIYDSFVDKMLLHCKKKYEFSSFAKEDLKTYRQYKDILLQFQKFFGLGDFTLKEIDKYLWQAGKKYFPKKYY